MKTVTLTLPAYWASYLINGDATGDSDLDIETMDRFLKVNDHLGPALSADEGPGFRKYHDANYYMVGSCECLTFTFPLKDRT